MYHSEWWLLPGIFTNIRTDAILKFVIKSTFYMQQNTYLLNIPTIKIER